MSATTSPTPASPTIVARRRGVPAAIGIAAVLALAVGAGLILLLQFIPPTDAISPMTRTISEYGLSANKWLFTVAVLLVAGGSAALFAVHLRRRAMPAASAVAGAVWTASLLAVVAFPKTNWATGPSADGTVHRIASVIGFVCLPVGILLASGRVFPAAAAWRRVTRWLGTLSLLWFGVIVGAVVVAAVAGGHWWQLIPLGLVERLMALTEVLAVATLAVPLLARE
jgi:uncharacterized protein DUF998